MGRRQEVLEILRKEHLGDLTPLEFLNYIFFQRLVTGYADLGIKYGSSNTTWTHEMIRLAVVEGKRWYFQTQRERDRWDVKWLTEIFDSLVPVLRYEHENSSDYETQLDMIDFKLIETTIKHISVLMLIGHIYPGSLSDHKRLVNFTERQCKRRLPKECALLLITDSSYYSTIDEDAEFRGNSMVANLLGFLFTNQGEVKKMLASRGCDVQGNYYAYMD